MQGLAKRGREDEHLVTLDAKRFAIWPRNKDTVSIGLGGSPGKTLELRGIILRQKKRIFTKTTKTTQFLKQLCKTILKI